MFPFSIRTNTFTLDAPGSLGNILESGTEPGCPSLSKAAFRITANTLVLGQLLL